MKKLLGTLVFAAALMYGAVAQAALLAAVNIVATERSGAEQGTWDLTIETTLPVAAIGIGAPETATFVINAANTAIAPLGSGSSFTPAATPGRFSLNLNPTTCAGVNCTPFATTTAPTLIGVFTTTDLTIENLIFADDDSVGGTAFDSVLNPYDISQISIQNYAVTAPEPSAALMLGLGLAALSMVRRKAA